MTSKSNRVTMLVRGGLLAVVIAASAACGGSSDRTSTSADSDGGAGAVTTLDPRDAALEFTKCMRENGVDMPDPDANGQILIGGDPDVDPAVQARAEEACRSYLDDAVPAGGDAGGFPARDALLRFAECMRGEGIDFPDPDFSGGNGQVVIGAPGGPSFDPSDPAFQAASVKCEKEAGLQMPGGDSNGG